MSQSYVMSFDMGTTNIKSILMDQDGQIVTTGRHKVKAYFPKDSWVEVNASDWWDVVCGLSREMLATSKVDKKDVKGIVVASAACGLTPMGEDQMPLRPSIVWLDNRASAEAEMVMDMFGGREAFLEQMGLLLCGKDAVIKQLWYKIHEPDLYEKTVCMLDDAGYILHRATGRYVCSRPNASAIGYDFENKTWDYQLIGALELKSEMYPDLVDSVEIVGPLTAVAAEEMGLTTETQVLGGCTDMQGIEMGSGCVKPGDSFFYLGTSGLLGIISEEPQQASPAATPLVSGNPANVMMMGTSEMAGGCIDWSVENLFKAEHAVMGKDVLPYADDQLKKTSPGADNLFFSNWLYGERNPMLDEWARASFVNLSVLHTRDHMLRAVYEGVAYQMVWILNELEKNHNLRMDRLVISGGGALSKNWMQIFADVSGRPADIVADAQMSVAKGAGYIGLVGLGLWKSFDTVAERIVLEQTFEPIAAHVPIYEAGMERYIEIYHSLKNLFAKLNS